MNFDVCKWGVFREDTNHGGGLAKVIFLLLFLVPIAFGIVLR